MVILYYLFPVPVFIAMVWYSYRSGYDRITLVALLTSISLCYFHLYHTSWDTFTIDPIAHADYVKYIAEHDSLPSREETSAARHPPTYYIASALVYKLAADENWVEPLLVVRHVSMACFIVFILFSINLLRAFLPPPGVGYYSGLLLLLFWPLGITMASRITCDVLLYAAQAGTLYYLARWFQKNDAIWLRGAFIWAGISVLAKNTGVIILGVSCAALLLALYEHRAHIRAILRRDVCLSIVFAFSCYVLTYMHGWIHALLPAEQPYDLNYIGHWLGSFNIFVFLYETRTGIGQGSFWNVMLHTILLGTAFPWKADLVLMLFNILWFAVLIYLVDGTLRFFRNLSLTEKRVFQLSGFFTVSMIGAMIGMGLRTGNVAYADGRYLYPVITLLALCYAIITQHHLKAAYQGIYRIGVMLAGSFPILTMTLFFMQYCVD